MRRLGQHFLRSSAIVRTIIGALELRGDEAIVEVGPGHGELTVPLAKACQQQRGPDSSAAPDPVPGAHGRSAIIAIEKDAVIADELRARLRAEGIAAVAVRTGDALGVIVELAAAASGINEPYKIVGNVPYYLTGRLLRVLGELDRKPERAVLMLQREVAERICAGAGAMNRLAASVQFWTTPAIVRIVPKRDFFPPPGVDSAVVLLKTKPAAMPDAAGRYYAVVRALFAQPRKTILNNLLANRAREANGGDLREMIARALESASVPPSSRPQDLTVPAIAALAEALFHS